MLLCRPPHGLTILLRTLLCAVLPLFLVSTLHAAAGDTDTASTTVTMSVPALVKLSNLQDMAFDAVDQGKGLEAEQNVCVWSSSRGYSLAAFSDNPAGSDFAMIAADESKVIYTVLWNDGQSGAQQLSHGQSITAVSAASSSDCSDAASQPLLRLEVGKDQMGQAKAGVYSDTIRFLVQAE